MPRNKGKEVVKSHQKTRNISRRKKTERIFQSPATSLGHSIQSASVSLLGRHLETSTINSNNTNRKLTLTRARVANRRNEWAKEGHLINKIHFSREKLRDEDFVESFQLPQVRHLVLSNNLLTKFELCRTMDNLICIDISGNQITTFPSVATFQCSPSLRKLNMSYNKLEVIPEDSLHVLSDSLEELKLSYNRIKSLPDSIHVLQKLISLNIDNNHLTALPTSLVQLRRLRPDRFLVSGNKIQDPPQSFLQEKGLRGFIEHVCNNSPSPHPHDYSRLEKDYLKIVIVGEDGAGKDLTARSLRSFHQMLKCPVHFNQRQNEEDYVTITGIYRTRVLQEAGCSNPPHRELKLNLWEFQDIPQDFQSALGTFYSRHALHIVVWDLAASTVATPSSSSSAHLPFPAGTAFAGTVQDVQYWIDLIQARVPGATILIVLVVNDSWFSSNNLQIGMLQALKAELEQQEADRVAELEREMPKYDTEHEFDRKRLCHLRTLQTQRPRILPEMVVLHALHDYVYGSEELVRQILLQTYSETAMVESELLPIAVPHCAAYEEIRKVLEELKEKKSKYVYTVPELRELWNRKQPEEMANEFSHSLQFDEDDYCTSPAHHVSSGGIAFSGEDGMEAEDKEEAADLLLQGLNYWMQAGEIVYLSPQEEAEDDLDSLSMTTTSREGGDGDSSTSFGAEGMADMCLGGKCATDSWPSEEDGRDGHTFDPRSSSIDSHSLALDPAAYFRDTDGARVSRIGGGGGGEGGGHRRSQDHRPGWESQPGLTLGDEIDRDLDYDEEGEDEDEDEDGLGLDPEDERWKASQLVFLSPLRFKKAVFDVLKSDLRLQLEAIRQSSHRASAAAVQASAFASTAMSPSVSLSQYHEEERYPPSSYTDPSVAPISAHDPWLDPRNGFATWTALKQILAPSAMALIPAARPSGRGGSGKASGSFLGPASLSSLPTAAAATVGGGGGKREHHHHDIYRDLRDDVYLGDGDDELETLLIYLRHVLVYLEVLIPVDTAGESEADLDPRSPALRVGEQCFDLRTAHEDDHLIYIVPCLLGDVDPSSYGVPRYAPSGLLRFEKQFHLSRFAPMSLMPHIVAKLFSRRSGSSGMSLAMKPSGGPVWFTGKGPQDKWQCFRTCFVQTYGERTVWVLLDDQTASGAEAVREDLSIPWGGGGGGGGGGEVNAASAYAPLASSSQSPSWTPPPLAGMPASPSPSPSLSRTSGDLVGKPHAAFPTLSLPLPAEHGRSASDASSQSLFEAPPGTGQPFPTTPYVSTPGSHIRTPPTAPSAATNKAVDSRHLYAPTDKGWRLRIILFEYLFSAQAAVQELHSYERIIWQVLGRYQGLGHVSSRTLCPLCLMRQVDDDDCGVISEEKEYSARASLVDLVSKYGGDKQLLVDELHRWEREMTDYCPQSCPFKTDVYLPYPADVVSCCASEEDLERFLYVGLLDPKHRWGRASLDWDASWTWPPLSSSSASASSSSPFSPTVYTPGEYWGEASLYSSESVATLADGFDEDSVQVDDGCVAQAQLAEPIGASVVTVTPVYLDKHFADKLKPFCAGRGGDATNTCVLLPLTVTAARVGQAVHGVVLRHTPPEELLVFSVHPQHPIPEGTFFVVTKEDKAFLCEQIHAAKFSHAMLLSFFAEIEPREPNSKHTSNVAWKTFVVSRPFSAPTSRITGLDFATGRLQIEQPVIAYTLPNQEVNYVLGRVVQQIYGNDENERVFVANAYAPPQRTAGAPVFKPHSLKVVGVVSTKPYMDNMRDVFVVAPIASFFS